MLQPSNTKSNEQAILMNLKNIIKKKRNSAIYISSHGKQAEQKLASKSLDKVSVCWPNSRGLMPETKGPGFESLARATFKFQLIMIKKKETK